MKFVISKRLFNSILSVVSKAISSTAPIPALSGVKIEVYMDHIVFIGSDSNISIKTEYPASDDIVIDSEGDIVLDSKYILDIVRKIDGDKITVETIDGTLIKISGTKAEFKLNGMRSSDYPPIQFDLENTAFTLDTKTLLDLVHQTSFACSDKETRPALTGVNLKASNFELKANATDSYRLALRKINLTNDENFDITIPAKILNDVCNIISETDTINISISENKVFFITANTIIRTAMIEDAYPDVSKLIPPSFSQVLTINAKELLDAVDRASFIKSDGRPIVKMEISADGVDISSCNQEIGSSHERLVLSEYRGDPITISCSGKYMSDAIKALRSEVITLSFSGELKPIILKSCEDENIIQLISPVRTYN